jgi:uncharacterized SAM-binding protein YcdF (DUF218 family)
VSVHDWPVSRRKQVRRQRRRMLYRGLLALLLAAFFAYLVGLWNFVESIPRQVEEPDRATDAIVVLTGGSHRLATGIKLLKEGKSHKLFVSGVNREVELGGLLAASSQSAADLPCCVTLGHAADDTIGNAIETQQWVQANDVHTVRLVTAAYHMPRSLLELHWAMPDVTFLANPVFPAGIDLDDWWQHWSSAGLMIGEYHKYLAARTRHWLADQLARYV